MRPSPRRQIILGTALAVATSTSAIAQSRTRPARVGVLIVPPPASYEARTQALMAGLRELGHADGVNVQIVLRSAQGRFDRLPELAAELVQQPADVVVVAGTPSIRAIKQATSTIPIVMAAVGDAVAGGHVESLARPGGNVTGSTYFAPEMAIKQLELLKEAFLQVTRVAVVFNPNNPAARSTLQAVEASARSLKLDLEPVPVKDRSEFDGAMAMMARQRLRVALIIDDPITISNAKVLADRSLKHQVAAGANFIEYADAGGLMSLGVHLTSMWRRSAFFVDKILKGTRPADIPVERATRFDLVINRKAATTLEINLAASILLRADRVIEQPVWHVDPTGRAASRSSSPVDLPGGPDAASSTVDAPQASRMASARGRVACG